MASVRNTTRACLLVPGVLSRAQFLGTRVCKRGPEKSRALLQHKQDGPEAPDPNQGADLPP